MAHDGMHIIAYKIIPVFAFTDVLVFILNCDMDYEAGESIQQELLAYTNY